MIGSFFGGMQPNSVVSGGNVVTSNRSVCTVCMAVWAVLSLRTVEWCCTAFTGAWWTTRLTESTV